MRSRSNKSMLELAEEISKLAGDAKPTGQRPTQPPLIIKKITYGRGGVAETPVFDLRSLGAKTSPTTGLRPGSIIRENVGNSSARGGGFRGRGGLSSGPMGRGGGFRGRGGPMGARGGRGRGGFRGEGRETTRAKRGRGDENIDDDGDNNIQWNEEQKAYIDKKAREEFGYSISVDPVEVTEESLIGRGPTVIVGHWGKSEVVEDIIKRMVRQDAIDGGIRHIELAERLLRGDLLRFRDEKEQKAVVALAQRMANEAASLKSEEKGEVVTPAEAVFEPVDEVSRQRLTEYLIQGDYKARAPKPSEAILRDVARRTMLNPSFRFKDTDTAVARVARLLPRARPSTTAPRSAPV
ncbi:MAG: hypothetical protein MMC33_002440 [Icmadophila ericetorum]|nr:hypothetical protein [Icmadophila ericetorum]